ncbi:GH22487 [Drosophila grimshawi]|uniref:GH22487 n=1 Tax=Drosophila grimshawi TaxID=7222 RepID=B4K205_DROGR|nr:GH22487 [Drosophila grimshawi]
MALPHQISACCQPLALPPVTASALGSTSVFIDNSFKWLLAMCSGSGSGSSSSSSCL